MAKNIKYVKKYRNGRRSPLNENVLRCLVFNIFIKVEFMQIYSQKYLYEVQITFYNILITHALEVDLNEKFKVQLIGQSSIFCEFLWLSMHVW